MTDPVVIPAVEDQICVMLEEIAGIKAIVGERILNTDYRMTAWENVANYKGAAVDVTDDQEFMLPTVAVDSSGVSRSLNIRGAGRYAERVDIWLFCPVGIQGNKDIRTMRDLVISLHGTHVPSHPIMMLARVDGPHTSDDTLIVKVAMDVTFIPEEA